jgi:hypothetical protein
MIFQEFPDKASEEIQVSPIYGGREVMHILV